jgi:sigma-B regulation protein RsbU (phosphoserine phosphatase)
MFAALTNTTWLLIILVTGGLLTLSFLIIQIVNRITAPITEFADSARAIAQGDFSGELPKVTSKDEMLQLHDAFSHLQEELKHYIEDLKETTAAKEKIESELRIARDIQLSMIPHTFPPYPDLPQIDLFAFLRSAREVGGDLYDFFILDKTKFCFAVGDVSGKGVPASLFMAVTRTLLRTIADTTQSPSEMLNTLNKSLAFNNKANMFVTFFLGILDLETGELKFANAGHNPPLLIKSNGEVELFEVAGGIPLGLFSSYEYPESTITLSAGDKIFGFTDGVNEAENAQEEQFEDERILEYITKFANKNPRELVDAMSVELEDFVQGYVQSDDITMMAVAFNGDVKTEA